jgi:predicted enzyme related to lactoylglutathione lyase
MQRVTGIGGIFFKTRNPQQMMAWYRKHLGIPAGNDAEAHAIFDWRAANDPERQGSTVWALFPHDTGYFQPSESPFMINYRVADLDGLLAQLREEGVAVEDRIDEYEYGRFAWITDPEGNRIELWEPPLGTAGRPADKENETQKPADP